MKSARVGYTKCLNHVIAYHVHQDPCSILVVQPTVDDAEGYSKDEIAPMVRDTPVLTGLVADPKARDSGNTILKKAHPGGILSMVGANSARGFRRLTVRVVLFDETDGYPASAGQEGDQIQLGIKRTDTFWNRKIGEGSTPTIKGASRIESSFEASDGGYYYVPCPHCGNLHVLEWANLKWPEGRPEEAYFVCLNCGAVIEHRHKRWMVENGEWRGKGWTYRNGKFEFQSGFSGHIGFHIWAAYSYSPNAAWGKLAKEFLKVHKDPSKLKTFVNTVLAQTWEEAAEKADPDTLVERRENYGPENLPAELLLLTAGVDVQDDRLELEVVGWRAEHGDEPPESWGAEDRVFYGDPAKPEVWKTLDEALLRTYRTQDGRVLRIAAACIDSGGHHTAQVYAFCQKRLARRVYAIKGKEGLRPIWPKRASKSKKYNGALVWIVGADTAKDAIYSRLRITEPGPGYCHFPVGYEEAWFKQLTTEKVRTRYVKGSPVREWIKPNGARVEALDKRVYALAALHSLHPIHWGKIAANAERAQEQPPPPAVEKPPEPIEKTVEQHQKQRTRRPAKRGGYANKWKPF